MLCLLAILPVMHDICLPDITAVGHSYKLARKQLLQQAYLQ